MRRASAGVNKPIDRILKAFTDEAPRILLEQLGMVKPSESVHIEPLRPETAPPMIMPDYVALLAVGRRRPFIFHLEYQLYYYRQVLQRIARYGGSLAMQHLMMVRTILLLLQRRGAPRSLPEEAEFNVEGTRILHPLQTVRMWELDPKPILRTNDPRLFPWAVLMDSTDAEVRRIASEVAGLNDEEILARFISLGSVRYDRNQLERMLGGSNMGLVEAILEGSSVVKHLRRRTAAAARAKGLEAGRAEGREQGIEAGRLTEARRLLRTVLQRRYPGLETMPELDSIGSLDTLESLLIEKLMAGSTRAQVERAVRSAAAAAAASRR